MDKASIDAAIVKAADDLFRLRGESVVYTPSDGLTLPFPAAVILGEIQYDQPISDSAIADVRACQVRHSTYTAQGLAGPVVKMDRKKGDAVTVTGLDGEEESWDVIGKRSSNGLWILTLARNIRGGI